jgi:hypothetical protein
MPNKLTTSTLRPEPLITLPTNSLGEPNAMAASFSHVLDWSRPTLSVTVRFTTIDPATMDAPTTLPVAIRLQRGAGQQSSDRPRRETEMAAGSVDRDDSIGRVPAVPLDAGLK